MSSTTPRPSTGAWPNSSPRSPRSPPPTSPPRSRTPCSPWSAAAGSSGRAVAVFDNQCLSDSTPQTEALEEEYNPRFAAHRDAIRLDRALFARIDALFADRDALGLDPESLRLLERYHADFVRAGARLSEEKQARLRELNAELAQAETAFQQNLVADTKARALVLEDAGQLAGLSPDAVASAAQNATDLGHDGRYVLSLKLFSNQSELSSLDDRSVRERLLAASLGRGEEKNGGLVVRLATLRARRAALLGRPSHAAHVVADATAGTTGAVEDLLARLVPPAVANARAEAEALQEVMAGGEELRAWDWKYCAEKVRQKLHDVDEVSLRPYFELERVLRDGVFHAAGLVYGVRVHRASRPGRLPPGRAGLRGDRGGRLAGGPVPGRLLRAGLQARRRVDEFAGRPVAPVRRSGRWWSTTSTSPSRRPVSPRC